MHITPRLRRYLTVVLVLVVFVGIFMTGLYLWFIHNTTTALQRMVDKRSNGTMALEVRRLRFNPLTHVLSARDAYLFSTDTLHQPVTYDARVPRLDVQVASVWDLLVHRQLLLDSIELHDPLVQVTRRLNKPKTDTGIVERNDGLSIAEEIGTVYNTMLDGLNNFGVKRIRMKNAGFRLVDATQPDLKPTFVNQIDLDLLRNSSLAEKRDTFVQGAQKLDVQIQNQDIHMPNGRHRLSFGKLRLELFRQRVVLDSCTITAIATDSARSAYTVFFDSLMLVGVDFGAMYRSNVLRADSVYCVSPVFNVHVDNSKSPVKVPDPAKVIREFTSDMDMKYLAVKDATIKLDVRGPKNRALVNSVADNFEIRGLRVYADSLVPVAVDEFDMRVSDYKLYNTDSTTVYAFDSVHFLNNTVALSNFSVVTTSHPNRVRNERSFEIPHFALIGLDWYQLIFEQNLRAREAILYHPDIRYTRNLPVQRQSQTQIISSLHTLDSLLTLDRITIVNGSVFASLGNAGSFQFEDVDLLVNSSQVLSATGVTELRNALQRLVFSNGHVRYGHADIELENVRSANGLVQAGKVIYTADDSSVDAIVHNAVIGNLLLDNKTESALIDGIDWSDADVTIHALPNLVDSNGAKNKNIALRNVNGRNTKLTFTHDSLRVSTMVSSLQLNALDKVGNGSVRVQAINVNGNAFEFHNGTESFLKAEAYTANDRGAHAKELVIRRNSVNDSLDVRVPNVDITYDVNTLLKNDFHFENIEAFNPNVRYTQIAAGRPLKNNDRTFVLQSAVLHEPSFDLTLATDAGNTSLKIPERKNGLVELRKLSYDSAGFSLAALRLTTSSIQIETASDDRFTVDTGIFVLSLRDVRRGLRSDSTSASAFMDSFKVENASATVGVGDKQFFIDSLNLGGVLLSKKSLETAHAFSDLNSNTWIRTCTGSYNDSINTWRWYGLTRDPIKQTLTLDSIAFHPRLSQEEFMAKAQYQTDYITFQTNAVALEGLTYNANDSAYYIRHTLVRQPVITAYRDKKMPFRHGIIKPLPTDMIKRIPFRLDVQRVDIQDGLAAYTERHPRTRNTGTITLNRMRGTMLNVKNYDLQPSDSLTLVMDTRLLDTVGTHVKVRQAYADTLNTFRISVWLEPAPLPALNPVLAPLMNVAVASGQLDSFRMRAVGREYVSLGETEMFYHDLRVRLLKDGDLNKRSLKHRIASSLINAFVVKSNNRERVGVVFYERDRERSFFNYLVKMSVSGMGTSMGFKRNERFLKRYVRTLEQRAAPPVDFEISDPGLDSELPQTQGR